MHNDQAAGLRAIQSNGSNNQEPDKLAESASSEDSAPIKKVKKAKPVRVIAEEI